MRTVCRLAREVLDIAAKHIQVGVTTDELDRIVHEATIERNAYPSPLNYRGFPKSCCTSVNEVICHGIPDQRPLQEGDIVNIDVTLYYDGFHGDLNETYLVGNVDEAGRKLVQGARDCLMKAIEHGMVFVLISCITNVLKLNLVFGTEKLETLYRKLHRVTATQWSKPIVVMVSIGCFTVHPAFLITQVGNFY